VKYLARQPFAGVRGRDSDEPDMSKIMSSQHLASFWALPCCWGLAGSGFALPFGSRHPFLRTSETAKSDIHGSKVVRAERVVGSQLQVHRRAGVAPRTVSIMSQHSIGKLSYAYRCLFLARRGRQGHRNIGAIPPLFSTQSYRWKTVKRSR